MATKTWIGVSGGNWSTATNWSPTAAPTTLDDVTVTGTPTANRFTAIPGGAYGYSAKDYNDSQAINGAESAGTITYLSDNHIISSVSAAAIIIGTAGVLTLTYFDSDVTAGSISVLNGFSLLTYGRFTVSGALSLGGGAFIANTATDGSTGTTNDNEFLLNKGVVAQVGSLTLSTLKTDTNTISVVDATSSFEVGASGGALVGGITIDAGRAVSGAGQLLATTGIVNNGTLTAVGGLLLLESATASGVAFSGSGSLQIGAGGLLDVYGVANQTVTQTVRFVGSGGTFITSSAAAGVAQQQGAIYGFDATDRIVF